MTCVFFKHRYAAKKVFAAVNKPSVHESAVKVAGYILGEFGHLIADNDVSRDGREKEKEKKEKVL